MQKYVLSAIPPNFFGLFYAKKAFFLGFSGLPRPKSEELSRNVTPSLV